MTTFDEFFVQATGHPPYGYQARLTRDGLPAVLEAPTGTGKTGIILAWLWRRLHGPDWKSTPRRLVFALPQRTLVEQVAGAAETWLARLGLTEHVPLHVVMGGAGKTQGRWRTEMDKPTIVVGTVDSLVSKILNRGYGISRSTYPIDFALVTSGAHWVIDEIQLCPESTTTLRQVAAFADAGRARSWTTAEPFGLTCMSATVSPDLLHTVDNPYSGDVLRIEPQERVGALAGRLGAARTIRRLERDPGDHAGIAAAVRELHRPGTLTLVVVNTVKTAREVFRALRDTPAPCTLLHSRFRGIEREDLIRRLTEEPGERDHIVVSTQVVEAGVDINATVLVSEAAPWPSMVQRAGRCNRTGEVDNATLWWIPPAAHAPYEKADVEATVAELTGLENQTLTGEGLLMRTVFTTPVPVSVIRRPDLLALFDTAPDLSGADVDVAPYVRDSDDLDVQLAWAQWTSADASGAPPVGAKPPEARLRCRVPLGELRFLARNRSVWRHNQANDRWTRVTDREPARPGEVLVMAAKDGGYDARLGFDSSIRSEVVGCPPLATRPDPSVGSDPTAGAEDAYKQDDTSVSQRAWVSLRQHSEDTRAEAQKLLDAIDSSLPAELRRAVVVAAYAHDAGKSHPTWQDALCDLATEEESAHVHANRPWAKSRSDGRLEFAGGVNFRHELASLLLLDGPLRGLIDGVEDPDLVRYLVLAHHGKLRLQARGLEDTDEKVLLGIRDGDVIVSPPMLGQPGGEVTADIGQFALGGERSWTRIALRLRDRYGPFRLAYLETLVRIADWRASANPTQTPPESKEAR